MTRMLAPSTLPRRSAQGAYEGALSARHMAGTGVQRVLRGGAGGQRVCRKLGAFAEDLQTLIMYGARQMPAVVKRVVDGRGPVHDPFDVYAIVRDTCWRVLVQQHAGAERKKGDVATTMWRLQSSVGTGGHCEHCGGWSGHQQARLHLHGAHTLLIPPGPKH